mmetsp:Transcript_6598/g.14305  ORF Transcript_6598/g.14305 Transcript_6598/m.14305 type:complete len:390 (+) Transcript_6598:31-1200(+)
MRPLSSTHLLPAFVPPKPHSLILINNRHGYLSPVDFEEIQCHSQPPSRRLRKDTSRHHKHSWVPLHSSMSTTSSNASTDGNSFYGLTEDGDFAMIGINVEEESAKTNDKEGDGGIRSREDLFRGITFSGLMDGTGDGAIPSASSSTDPEIHVDDFVASRSARGDVNVNVNGMRSFSRGSSSRKNVQANPSNFNSPVNSRAMSSIDNMSLNDALFGRIQLEDSAAENSAVNEKRDRVPSNISGTANSSAAGSIIGGTTKEFTSARDTKIYNDVGIHPDGRRNQSAPACVDRTNNNNSNSRSSNDTKTVTQQQNYEDDETLLSIQTIKEWLVELIPTLPDKELDAYARGLDDIGFHPECITMSELQFEDLGFMKVLHQRYVFHEVTGVKHP